MTKLGAGGILDRILDPVSSSLNADASAKLVALKADRKAQARVAELASKCNESELTPEERHEYESYIMANHLVAILAAKAKLLSAR